MKRKFYHIRKAAVMTVCALTLSACAESASSAQSTVLATANATESASTEQTRTETGTTTTREETGETNAVSALSLLDMSTLTEVNVSDLVCNAGELNLEEAFTDRDKDPSYNASSAHTITFHGGSDITCSDRDGLTVAEDGSNTVTITKEGVYVVSGETDDYQIVVDVDDTAKVQIVLNGVTMVNDDGACIFVKNADKVFITLAEGTINTLSDTGDAYTQPDDGSTVDGVIFARDDICFQGTGTLVVNANYRNGIVGKDDLKITGGVYEITASNKGIQANDSIRILDGDLTITANDDAIHTDTDDTEQKGYVYIAGGRLTLASGDDGIHAATALIVAGGTIDVTESYEGLEGDTIDIVGGTVNVKASDDGLNATGVSESEDTQDDQEGEGPTGGRFGGQPFDFEAWEEMAPEAPPEGFDGRGGRGGRQQPQGDMEPPADGGEAQQNDTTQQPQRGGFGGGGRGGFGGGGFGGFGGGFGDASDTAYIRIANGVVTVDADGDGVDSNGYLYMTGGELYVNGPTSNGDGALDVGYEAYISGGVCVAAGSSGMAETFSSQSSQYAIRYYFSGSVSGGTTMTLSDENGDEVAQFTPEKTYGCIIVSAPAIVGGTYTINAGDRTETFTVSETSTTIGQGGYGGFGR